MIRGSVYLILSSINRLTALAVQMARPDPDEEETGSNQSQDDQNKTDHPIMLRQKEPKPSQDSTTYFILC